MVEHLMVVIVERVNSLWEVARISAARDLYNVLHVKYSIFMENVNTLESYTKPILHLTFLS